MAQTPQGMTQIPGLAQPQPLPTTFLQGRYDQLGGGQSGINPALLASLRQTPQSFTPQALQASNSAQLLAMQAAQAQAQMAQSSGGGGGGGGGLENPNQFGQILGLSDEAVQAAASKYAGGRSFGGSAYQPHMVMQEGHVEYRNGVPGIYVKYATAAGDSTEWTPLQ
jgi:hypothetical protein